MHAFVPSWRALNANRYIFPGPQNIRTSFFSSCMKKRWLATNAQPADDSYEHHVEQANSSRCVRFRALCLGGVL